MQVSLRAPSRPVPIVVELTDTPSRRSRFRPCRDDDKAGVAV